MDPKAPHGPESIPETVAQRVLARAAELDAAWREVSALTQREAAVAADARARPGVFHQLWRRLRHPDDPAMRLSTADRILTGATATAGALGLWIGLVQLADAFGAPWLFLPLSQFVAAGLAIRSGPAHWALMLAGIAGVALGAFLGSRRMSPEFTLPAQAPLLAG
ncbi:MAG: hypothetical protein IPJ78_02615 [Gemmatimonadetes bacterium]|nr:hypothetical protein [Gemmatimonadota bacterium]